MIYLKFETPIAGDAKAEGFVKSIQIDSMSWGTGRGIGSVTGTPSRQPTAASFSEVSLSKGTDSSSPILFEQASSGKSLGKATLSWTNSSAGDGKPEVFQTIILGNAIISSYSMSSGSDGQPSESFSINFDKVEFSYKSYDGGKFLGESKAIYDLSSEKKS